MKPLILSAAYTVICCCAFAQTKNTDSIKRNAPISSGTPSSTSLIQEKVWPVPYSNFKNKTSIIIKPATAIEIRTRL
jgi:hypothetical protein